LVQLNSEYFTILAIRLFVYYVALAIALSLTRFAAKRIDILRFATKISLYKQYLFLFLVFFAIYFVIVRHLEREGQKYLNDTFSSIAEQESIHVLNSYMDYIKGNSVEERKELNESEKRILIGALLRSTYQLRAGGGRLSCIDALVIFSKKDSPRSLKAIFYVADETEMFLADPGCKFSYELSDPHFLGKLRTELNLAGYIDDPRTKVPEE
jgi:hypothetical protein